MLTTFPTPNFQTLFSSLSLSSSLSSSFSRASRRRCVFLFFPLILDKLPHPLSPSLSLLHMRIDLSLVRLFCLVAAVSAASASASASSVSHCKTLKRDASVSCLEHAVDMFLDIGGFDMSARYNKEIAELYEAEQNFKQAIFYYERAADLFQYEEVTTSVNQCKQKIAQFNAQLGQ